MNIFKKKTITKYSDYYAYLKDHEQELFSAFVRKEICELTNLTPEQILNQQFKTFKTITAYDGAVCADYIMKTIKLLNSLRCDFNTDVDQYFADGKASASDINTLVKDAPFQAGSIAKMCNKLSNTIEIDVEKYQNKNNTDADKSARYEVISLLKTLVEMWDLGLKSLNVHVGVATCKRMSQNFKNKYQTN